MDVDSAGVARFSVAGTDATSDYIVQFPKHALSLSGLAQAAEANCADEKLSSDGQECASGSASAALIMPSRALLGGGRLAIGISQALNKRLAGDLSIQVNYN